MAVSYTHLEVYKRQRFAKPFASVEMDTTAITLKGKRVGTAYIARFNFDTANGEQDVYKRQLWNHTLRLNTVHLYQNQKIGRTQ